MEKLQLTRVGEHRFDGNLYRDAKGNYYVDLFNDVKDDGVSSVYILSPSKEPDGEPDRCIECHIKLTNPLTEREKRMKDFIFEYALLSRLMSDCDGYCCIGDCRYHNINNIWGCTVESHIKKMKEVWKQFPEDLKPEWCTWEDILEYEKKMRLNNEQGSSRD